MEPRSPDRGAAPTGSAWIPVLLLLPFLACGPGDAPGAGSGDAGPETAGDRPPDAAGPAGAAGPTAGDTAASRPAYGIRVVADRAVYAPGETIHMRLEVFRRGGDPLTLHFSSAQRHDFLIRGPESAATPGVAWRWSDGRFFAQGTDTVTLGPGRPALTAAARHPAPGRPGRYRLEARVTASEWPLSATVPITVAP